MAVLRVQPAVGSPSHGIAPPGQPSSAEAYRADRHLHPPCWGSTTHGPPPPVRCRTPWKPHYEPLTARAQPGTHTRQSPPASVRDRRPMAMLQSPSGDVPTDTPHRFIYPPTLCWAGLRAQRFPHRVSVRAVAPWPGADTNLRAGAPPTYPAVRRPPRPPDTSPAPQVGRAAQGLPSRTLTRQGCAARVLRLQWMRDRRRTTHPA